MSEPEKLVQAEKLAREDTSTGAEQAEHVKTEGVPIVDTENLSPGNLNVVFENPLANIPREQLLQDVEDFCQKYNLMDHIDVFRKGALVSQNPSAAMDLNDLTDEEKNFLLREHTHKWHQPWQLYWLVGKYCKSTTCIYKSHERLMVIFSHVFDGSRCTRHGRDGE
jgi:hypothetical protein